MDIHDQYQISREARRRLGSMAAGAGTPHTSVAAREFEGFWLFDYRNYAAPGEYLNPRLIWVVRQVLLRLGTKFCEPKSPTVGRSPGGWAVFSPDEYLKPCI